MIGQISRYYREVVIVMAAVVLVAAALVGNLATYAAFTDTATVATSTFTAGSIDLQLAAQTTFSSGGLANLDCSTATFADNVSTALFNTAARVPGDVVTVPLCVKNVGDLPTQWNLSGTVTDTASGNLLTQMKLRLWSVATASTACAQGIQSNGSAAALASVTDLFTTGALATTVTVPASANTAVNAASTQKLCLSVALPDTITDTKTSAASIQGKAMTMGWTFTGNQTTTGSNNR